MKKKCIKIGLITALIWTVLIITIFFIRFGENWLTNEEPGVLYFFIPLWTAIMFGVGYGSAKRFYMQKELYFPFDTIVKEMEDTPQKELWRIHKRLMIANISLTAAKIFAIVTPVYLLAYLDNSFYLKSNIGLIITFGVLSIVCFFTSKYIKKAA